MTVDTLVFAGLLGLLATLLGVAFAPDDLAVLRRWRLEWRVRRRDRRVRRYSANWFRHGFHLPFWLDQLDRIEQEHRLAGGGR